MSIMIGWRLSVAAMLRRIHRTMLPMGNN